MNPNLVKAKKHLGQHFLKDEEIAQRIVDSLITQENYKQVLEVGPGMGVLTQFLIKNINYSTSIIDIDLESIDYLKKKFPALSENIIYGDFLTIPLEQIFKNTFAVIGNFPYNISSQILFKTLEHKNQITEIVGMFQKEVAERIASKPGNKAYGILSVFMQTFYSIEYLFTVDEEVFIPPPKVKSGVIRCIRNKRIELECNEKLFYLVVKTGFNQRRKTLRNALKSIMQGKEINHKYISQRAEELSVEEFIELTVHIEKIIQTQSS